MNDQSQRDGSVISAPFSLVCGRATTIAHDRPTVSGLLRRYAQTTARVPRGQSALNKKAFRTLGLLSTVAEEACEFDRSPTACQGRRARARRVARDGAMSGQRWKVEREHRGATQSPWSVNQLPLDSRVGVQSRSPPANRPQQARTGGCSSSPPATSTHTRRGRGRRRSPRPRRWSGLPRASLT